MKTSTNPMDEPDFAVVPQKPKQVILVRTDIGMKPGKIASQVAHASMKVFFDKSDRDAHLNKFGICNVMDKLKIDLTVAMSEWVNGEFTKIVLEVNSEEELLKLHAQALADGLPCSLIQDNGHTVFNGVKTFTTAAIGPAYPAEIDPITKHLKLLK